MLESLDHVVVAVRDLDAATADYELLLGRKASWRGSHPSYGTANTLFKLENTYLELLSPAGEGLVAKQLEERFEEHGEGPALLAFGTPDAEAFAKTSRERGLSASDPVPGEGRDHVTDAVRQWRNVFLPPEQTRGVQIFAIEHLSPPDALPEATPSAAENSVITSLDHVVIMSQNAEATRELYGDRLGIRLALDRSFEKRGVRLLFFRVGGATVEIGTRLDAEPSDEPDRFWGIAWQVPNADAARERLLAAGFDMTGVRDGNKAGTRVTTVKNRTHGVPTLIIEPVERSS